MRKAREQIIEVGLNGLIEVGLRPRVSLAVAPRLILAALDGLSIRHEIDPIPPDEEAGASARPRGHLALFEI